MFNVGILAVRRVEPNVFYNIVPLVPHLLDPGSGEYECTLRFTSGVIFNVTSSGYGQSGRYQGGVQIRAVLEAGVLRSNPLSDWMIPNNNYINFTNKAPYLPYFRVRVEARDATTLAPMGSARFWSSSGAP